MVRRSLRPGEKDELELVCYRCYSPEPVTLAEFAAVAGARRGNRGLLRRGQERGRPGSLPGRHAAVSLWLNSGVPATEVARRAGHGVAVLLKIYAHCIDGQADAANQPITDALGTTEPEPGPGDEEDVGSEPAA